MVTKCRTLKGNDVSVSYQPGPVEHEFLNNVERLFFDARRKVDVR